jgi:hypothetical protein
MEETLTVLKLELPAPLRGFLVTTNAIENLIGSARRTSRNVTRWRSGDMISRWAAVGLLQAEEHFRRIRGYRHLSLLLSAHCEQTFRSLTQLRSCVGMRTAAAAVKFNDPRDITDFPGQTRTSFFLNGACFWAVLY